MNAGLRRFSSIMGKAGDIIALSVIWILCCLPVLTMVPASAALYYAVVKSVRRDRGHALGEFFRAFRLNLKQGVGLSAICVLYALIVFVWWRFADGFPVDTAAGTVFTAISRILALLGALLCGLLCPLLSRFQQRFGEVLKTNAFLSFRHLAATLVCTMLLVVSAFSVYLMPLFLLFIPGMCALASSLVIEPIFLRYLPKSETGGDAWYAEQGGISSNAAPDARGNRA